MTGSRLILTRPQILAFRRRVGALDERLQSRASSLERAAWAGLQDSMPRAALLSIHARVERTRASSWEAPSLVQLWGPRYNAYVVARRDLAVFSLGRLPDDVRVRRIAEDLADRLHAFLDGGRMTYREAGLALGEPHNRLRYAALTGRVVMRWEGARAPIVWTVPQPEVEPREARLELARRYLHVFGPTTPDAFAQWSGIAAREGAAFRNSNPTTHHRYRYLDHEDTKSARKTGSDRLKIFPRVLRVFVVCTKFLLSRFSES
jgi:winged helix DNA-binding protein